ncbi:Uncharacterized protein TCM_002371 [Theobroma cacao]|uniref:Uncharacterized protein n=1 Tax=Theobroma cacao TaxID=3641 RepID=A0A061DLB0_THECC|nr:Uncharacterized protein TCM_002371 [Theobroma cacao]
MVVRLFVMVYDKEMKVAKAWNDGRWNIPYRRHLFVWENTLACELKAKLLGKGIRQHDEFGNWMLSGDDLFRNVCCGEDACVDELDQIG